MTAFVTFLDGAVLDGVVVADDGKVGASGNHGQTANAKGSQESLLEARAPGPEAALPMEAESSLGLACSRSLLILVNIHFGPQHLGWAPWPKGLSALLRRQN